VDEVWRGFKVEKSTLKGGYKPLYIDLGVVNLAKLWFVKQHIAVSGKRILSDGWYWTWDYGDQPPLSPTILSFNPSVSSQNLFRPPAAITAYRLQQTL
jgi:hypothetical protein